MGGIDTQTMYWATGVEEFCSAVMFWLVWRQDRTSQWIWWGIAFGMRALSHFIYWLIVANAFGSYIWPAQFVAIWLIMLSGAVSMYALTLMLKLRPPSLLAVAPIALIILVHFIVSWFRFDPRYRVGVQSLALAYAMSWMAITTLRTTSKENVSVGISLAFGAWALMQLSRAVAVVFFTPSQLPTSFAAAASNSWYYMLYQFVAMAVPVALLGERNRTLIKQLEKARQEALLRADRDGLTGLLNHNAIMEQAKVSMSAARKTREPMAVIMLDCDYFKRVNDEYGHQVGDSVLMSIGDLLNRIGWQNCHVGRYGSEEFMLILPAACEAEAAEVVADFMQTLRGRPVAGAAQPLFITVSAGIAIYDHRQDEALFQLIRRADVALLAAKARGRDRFEIAMAAS